MQQVKFTLTNGSTLAPQIDTDRKLLFQGEPLDVSPIWLFFEDTALWLVSGHNSLYQVQSCNSDIVSIVKELSQPNGDFS